MSSSQNQLFLQGDQEESHYNIYNRACQDDLYICDPFSPDLKYKIETLDLFLAISSHIDWSSALLNNKRPSRYKQEKFQFQFQFPKVKDRCSFGFSLTLLQFRFLYKNKVFGCCSINCLYWRLFQETKSCRSKYCVCVCMCVCVLVGLADC